jgi:hypothetical protein
MPSTTPICEDTANDGAGNYDLLTASVVSAEGGFRHTGQFIGPPVAGRDITVLFLLGDAEYQVGIASYPDGTTEAFVFDVGETRNTYIDNPLAIDGHFSVVVPDDLITHVTNDDQLNFTATLSVDGIDVDACPDS